MAGLTAGELAVRFGCELRGDPDRRLTHVGTLGRADAGALSFFVNPRLRAQLAATRAGAVVLDDAAAAGFTGTALVAPNPHATFARMASLLHPPRLRPPGRHASAVVAADAEVAQSAHIAAHCHVGAGVRIGPGAEIGPGCVIDDGAAIGAHVVLVARVVVGPGVVIGERSIVHPGAVLGADGFGYAQEGAAWLKVPQVGGLRIGADVEIGANTTVDRGAIEDTVIDDGVKLDNLIQVGHNVRIGAHTAVAGCTGIAGSTTIGARCQLAGMVGIAGHLTICDDVVLTARTTVFNDIREPGVYSGGIPGEKYNAWRRIVGRLKRIERMAARIRQLEHALRVIPQTDSEDDA
jgi:UDP-3-O-[3-hydroxymyristoyl] glucosamine N-acyltransferase